MEHEIDGSAKVRAAVGRVREVIIDDLGAVLSESCSEEQRRSRRFVCDLTVEFGSGTSLHQEVVVQAGALQLVDDVLLVPIQLHANGRERLFPIFEGHLGVSAERPGTRIRLTGRYTVPLGRLGHAGEGVLGGHRIATESLAHYVKEIARRVDAEVNRRVTSGSHHAEERSEHFIG
jgi:hypothetical protein